MGATKEMFMEMQEELMVKLEMPYSLYKELKYNILSTAILRSVYNPNVDYSKSEKWKQAKEQLKEAFVLKNEIEEQMRVERALGSNEFKQFVD